MILQSKRAWLWRFLVFVAVVSAGSLAWSPLEDLFGAGFRSAVNLLLENWTFGRGGHAELQKGRAAEEDHVGESWDTALVLTIDSEDGAYEPKRLVINSRRTAYIPLLLALATVAAAPLKRRRKLYALGVALPGVGIIAIFYVWLFAFCAFALVPGLCYDIGPAAESAINWLFVAGLTPPGNRIVGPLVVALCTVAWQWLAERHHARLAPQRATVPS